MQKQGEIKGIFLISTLLFIKFIIIYFVLGLSVGRDFFLSGGDAESYHLYATGYLYDREATNFWFWFLKYLNKIGLYNKEFVLYFILMINYAGLPLIFYKIINYSNFIKKSYLFYTLLGLIILFPSILFHSFDIYRDIVMLFVFLISLYLIKLNNNKNISFKSLLILAFGFWLLWFREYLGFAFLLAYFSSFYIDLSKNGFYFKIFIYVIFLFFLNYFGAFDSLIKYRDWFIENDANTNLKIDFNNKLLFIPNFLKSMSIQLFGFYFKNITTLFLFITESIIFILSLIYVFKNRKYFNYFVNFCIIFFIFYTSIWLISNDNFGTATRLRWFSYFPIYISMLIIYQIKRKIALDEIRNLKYSNEDSLGD